MKLNFLKIYAIGLTILLAVIFAIGVFLLGADFGRFTEQRKTNNTQEQVKKEEKYPNYTTYLTQEYYEKNGRNFVYGQIVKHDGKWYMEVDLRGVDRGQELVKKEISFDEQKGAAEYKTYKFVGAWDKNSKYLAVIWQDLGWMWDVSDKKSAKLVKSFSVSKDFYTNKLFFVGNLDDLYSSSGYILDRKTNQLVLNPDKGMEYAPLPRGDGYSYWLDSLSGYSYPNRLVVVKNKIKKIYDLGFEMDSAAEQIFSPDEKKVCFGTGSSGYWGYSIADLETLKIYTSGPQYSYCLNWLDNNRVMLKVVNYYYQWTSQYYIYDTRTDKMEFMFAGEPRLDWFHPPQENANL